MRIALKLSLISSALLFTACSSIAKDPVKHIDIYVMPYYDARDGRLEQININKDIDGLLLKNTQKDFEKAVEIIEKKADFVSPMTMFALSARAYDFGLRDVAVDWYYRGQNRLITALSVLNLPPQSVSDNTGFGQLVGQFVNPYAYCDLAKQRRAAQNAVDWTKAHPYAVLFLEQVPAKSTDRKVALAEAENTLQQRLAAQDKFFADSEKFAKWQKARQENFVNERFCC